MKLFIDKFEEVSKKRIGSPIEELRNVTCEICGTRIGWYIGPKNGIACASCIENSKTNAATRHAPLAITRSAIRE